MARALGASVVTVELFSAVVTQLNRLFLYTSWQRIDDRVWDRFWLVTHGWSDDVELNTKFKFKRSDVESY